MIYKVTFALRDLGDASYKWKKYHTQMIHQLSNLIISKIGLTPDISIIDEYFILVKFPEKKYNRYKLTMPLEKQYDVTKIDWLFTEIPWDNPSNDSFTSHNYEILHWFPMWSVC